MKLPLSCILIVATSFATPTMGANRPWQQVQRLAPYHAQCMVQRQRQPIREWLGLLAGSKSEGKAFKKIMVDFSICFGSANQDGWDYSFEPLAVREALISYLLEANWKNVPTSPPEKVEKGNWYSAAAMAESGVTNSVMAYSVGLCVARFDWADSRALTQARVGSNEERELLGKLIAFLPPCIPPKLTLRMDRARLRAIIEETVYHASVESIYA